MDHIVNGVENKHVGGNGVKHGEKNNIANRELDGIEMDGYGSHHENNHKVGVGGVVKSWYYFRVFLVSELTLPFQKKQNESNAQILPVPVHFFIPHMARKHRGKLRRNRTAVTINNSIWEITKVAGNN